MIYLHYTINRVAESVRLDKNLGFWPYKDKTKNKSNANEEIFGAMH